MRLDSITQTLSNPDCGLSKPHIPDNSPYISHRLIHSNRLGPHPQIYYSTCLSFSATMAAICLSNFSLNFTIPAPTFRSSLCLIFFLVLLLVLSQFIQWAYSLSPLLPFTVCLLSFSPSAPRCPVITRYIAVSIVVCNGKLQRTSD